MLLALIVAGATLCGSDQWAGRASHLAVVNSAVAEASPYLVSLRGEWEFVAFRHATESRDLAYEKNVDFWGKPGVWKNARTIRVPGAWEAQGVGEEGPSISYRCVPQKNFRLRHAHVGNGYYRRKVDIPVSWRGSRVFLKVGRVSTWGWAWVNGKPVAHIQESHRALKWEITDLVTPGQQAEVTFEVDNFYPTRNTQCVAFHRGGGLLRDVELEAVPQTFIDDAWVRGDFDSRKAIVNVDVEKADRENRSTADGLLLRVSIEGETKEVPVSNSTYSLDLELRMFRPWSPEHPNLYTARVELAASDGKVLQTRYERFGVRKLEVRGKEFYLNGHSFFVLGFGDDSVYPISGMSPASREFHRAHLQIAKDAGFNFVRTHTHCEVPEYFEAADEVGIFIQNELSYNGDESSEEVFEFDPVRDAKAVWETYRRHPSYVVCSGGNEGTLGPGAGRIFYRWMKEHDPDRLVIEEDGGTYLNNHSAETSDYASGPMSMWERGSYNPRAFICHEYANLCVKGDARMEDDYTGVWLPRMTRAQRRANLAAAGLGEAWGDRLQDAKHDLQRLWAIRSIEHARKDPFCDGFIFWTIVDYTHWSERAKAPCCQGLFDPFWRPKSHGATPADVARINSRTAILLDTEDRIRAPREDCDPMLACGSLRRLVIDETNRVFTAGETIPAEFILAHYGERDLADARLVWRLVGEGERVLASGERTLGTCAAGPARTVAKTRIAVPPVSRPVRTTLTATVLAPSEAASNAWTFWLFPSVAEPLRPDNVVVTAHGSDEAEAARKAGKSILLVGNRKGERDIMLGWWSLAWRKETWTQNGVAAVPHAIWGEMPFEPYLSPLHFRMIGQGTPLPVEGFCERDFVMVGEGIDDFKLYLAAKVRPDGGREVYVSGLDLWSGLPEGRTLLAGIYGFLGKGKLTGKKEKRK